MTCVNRFVEHIVSVIASMLKSCRGSQRTRLLTKFTENDHEKTDRLMELHFKYFDKLRVIDAQLQRNDDEEDEDEMYLKRLEGGLFTLQLVDYIMMEVCASGAATIKQRVLHTLNLRGGTVKTIREIMRGKHFRFSSTREALVQVKLMFIWSFSQSTQEILAMAVKAKRKKKRNNTSFSSWTSFKITQQS